MGSKYIYPKRYDVVVIGAGHAGIEAALASARMGCSTLLLTLNPDSIGQMSCNPAIGGLAKGHLVREIDAMGGEMGICTDMCGLQFRMLNTRKGPAVWAPRAQCDKKAYQFRMKWVCEKQPNLDVKQAQVHSIVSKQGVACGVLTSMQIEFVGETIIVTTGTFMRGLLHVGSNQQPGGRAGEAGANHLSASLKELGIDLKRLKTGTPPRLMKKSIDFSKLIPQYGDEPPPFFSFWRNTQISSCSAQNESKNKSWPENGYPFNSILYRQGGQIPCFLTHTTEKTRRIIKENLCKSPLYSGEIEGIGPRYCPSIEDKIVKFPGKDCHQIFLEPEGIETDEIYVNGLSTCLPFDVQMDLVRSVAGCEHAEIVRPAYAVEYDFSPPTQLHAWLETKTCKNLFFAGQINGTSGYEEAAAQGLMAGINAALRVKRQKPMVLGRDQAYIGVLIDDLVTKGTVEPYRMFTSRAEYRLILRQDNADMRLSEIGHSVGLLEAEKFDSFMAKKKIVENELRRLERTRDNGVPLSQLLRRPRVSYEDLPQVNAALSKEHAQQVEIAVKYDGYILRQQTEINRMRIFEEKKIPTWMNYQEIRGLRTEAKEKLVDVQPMTIGQASRISGVSPADVSLILFAIKRGASGGLTEQGDNVDRSD